MQSFFPPFFSPPPCSPGWKTKLTQKKDENQGEDAVTFRGLRRRHSRGSNAVGLRRRHESDGRQRVDRAALRRLLESSRRHSIRPLLASGSAHPRPRRQNGQRLGPNESGHGSRGILGQLHEEDVMVILES